MDFFTGLPQKILDAVGDLGKLLYNAGKAVLQGFLDGITSMFDSIKNKLGSLTSSLTSWKGPPSVDANILFNNGQLTIGGYIRGLESRYGDVQASLGGLTGRVGSPSYAGQPPRFAGAQFAGGQQSQMPPINITTQLVVDRKVFSQIVSEDVLGALRVQ